MFCRNCGKQLPDKSNFCSECGTKVYLNNDNTYVNTMEIKNNDKDKIISVLKKKITWKDVCVYIAIGIIIVVLSIFTIYWSYWAYDTSETASFSSPSKIGTRIYELNGKFSYCPPLNWSVKEFPGLKYKIVIGPIENNFTTNINFQDEIFYGNLKEYVNYSILQLPFFSSEYKLLIRNTFKTNSGIVGECVIVNNFQEGNLLRQIFYILPAPQNRYFVITCSVIDNVSSKYLSVFEESIKTFEIIN